MISHFPDTPTAAAPFHLASLDGEAAREWEARLGPALFRCWQRCAPRLDPDARPRLTALKADALDALLVTHFDLIAIARPVMEDIHQYVEGSDFAVVLVDRASCILDLFGDPSMLARLAALELRPGVYWDEGHAGSNALSLALREAMPIQVTGEEHYLRAYQGLTGSAAPIHDAKGRIVGALGMLGPAAERHSHTLGIVMSAARAITNQLQTDMYLQEVNFRLAELDGVLGAISEGLLSWDLEGRITHLNEQAAALLHLPSRSALGRTLTELLPLPPPLAAALARGESLQDAEVTFISEEVAVDCLVSLHPMINGQRGPVGYIMNLRPIQQVRQLVNRLTGAQAKLTLDDFLGNSPLLRRVRRQARIAARGSAPVLLRGEDGVGKDPLAQAIHNEGGRAEGPFVSINCMALPHEMMISEFLGYEPGGFPGAPAEGRPSKFELAHGGTLFLDEVESLSLEAQAALLQVLQAGSVTRLGGLRPIPIDVRVIATTAIDLEQLVAEGSFRSDLYYRFGVFLIDVPALRERPEDIPMLAEHVLERIARQWQRPFRLEREALDKLLAYPWPGNNRELATVLERAAAHAEEGIIRVRNLPTSVRSGWVITPGARVPQPVLSVQEAERDAILRAGWAFEGRVNQMAEHLGLSRTTLWRRMKRLGINASDFRHG